MSTQPIKVHRPSILFLLVLVLTACPPAFTPPPPGFTDVVSGKVDVGGHEWQQCQKDFD